MWDFLYSILQVWPQKSLIILALVYFMLLLPELLTQDKCKCIWSQLQRICFWKSALINSLFISTPAWRRVGSYWSASFWMLSRTDSYMKQNTLNENVYTLKHTTFIILRDFLYLNISKPHVQKERERVNRKIVETVLAGMNTRTPLLQQFQSLP